MKVRKNASDTMSKTKTTSNSTRTIWLILGIIIGIGILGFLASWATLSWLKNIGDDTTSYLEGAPITVKDETIRAAAQQDVSALVAGDITGFYERLGYSKAAARNGDATFESVIQTLEGPGDCSYVIDSIDKLQGGFDGGATIIPKGEVSCGKYRYDLILRYSGSALAAKEAADFSQFSLSLVTIETREADSFQAARVFVTPLLAKGDSTPGHTFKYPSLEAYKKALSNGAIGTDCRENIKKRTYSVSFRKDRGSSKNVKPAQGGVIQVSPVCRQIEKSSTTNER